MHFLYNLPLLYIHSIHSRVINPRKIERMRENHDFSHLQHNELSIWLFIFYLKFYFMLVFKWFPSVYVSAYTKWLYSKHTTGNAINKWKVDEIPNEPIRKQFVQNFVELQAIVWKSLSMGPWWCANCGVLLVWLRNRWLDGCLMKTARRSRSKNVKGGTRIRNKDGAFSIQGRVKGGEGKRKKKDGKSNRRWREEKENDREWEKENAGCVEEKMKGTGKRIWRSWHLTLSHRNYFCYYR